MSARAEWLLDGAALRIVLDRPKANILDLEMVAAIGRALDNVTPHTKVVLFEGAGDHFSFGASVAEHVRAKAPEMLHGFHALFRRLLALSVPTVAVVRGQCLGGGLELASWCSWVFASETAVFAQPEVRLAVFPPMASIVLPWRLGGAGALDLIVTGRAWPAAEAHARGLVHQVAPDPTAAALAFVGEHLAPKSAIALRFAETAAREDLARRLNGRLPDMERIYLDSLMATHDANEGIAAFMEKRAARYEDR